MTKHLSNFPSEKFETAFKKFLAGATAKRDAFYHTGESLLYTIGPKYIRVTHPGGAGVYCFVDLAEGKVWKAKSWESAEKKNPRSCIFDDDHGMSGINWCGTVYINHWR